MKIVEGTIEICSIHPGPFTYCRKNEEVVQVPAFKPTGEERQGKPVYVGLVDEEIAATYLGRIGLPDFWKPGAVVVEGEKTAPAADPTGAVSIETLITMTNFGKFKAGVKKCNDIEGLKGIAASLPEGGKKTEVLARIEELETPAEFTADSYSQIEDADNLKVAVADCTDAALLMNLIAGETQAENRQDFIDALQTRLDALNAG
jgi:hypothetical protein